MVWKLKLWSSAVGATPQFREWQIKHYERNEQIVFLTVITASFDNDTLSGLPDAVKYFGHFTRHNSLEKDVMLGPMPGLRRQGGQKRQWLDDLRDWTDMSLPPTGTSS